MSFLTLARVLFAFVAFQLAVGLQPGIASAATAQTVASPEGACRTHSVSDHSTTGGAQATALIQDRPSHDPSPLQHRCCKSSGCQGHCGNLSLALNHSIVRSVPDDSTLVRPVPTARAASALSDTHFRPPIAL